MLGICFGKDNSTFGMQLTYKYMIKKHLRNIAAKPSLPIF